MANKKSKKMTANKKAPRKRMAKRGPSPYSVYNAEYKRLLLDPCNAPLCRSPYGDEEGALVTRAHSVVSNSQDNQLFFYHPVFGYFHTTSPAGVTGNIVPISPAAATTGSARGLAACLEVTYVGPEQDRAGLLYCGLVPGQVVWNLMAGTSGGGSVGIDVANAANYFTNVERMPVDRCSVNWFPSDQDQEFLPGVTYNAADTAALRTLFSKSHFIAVLVAGSVANGLRIQSTYVIEATNTNPGALVTGFGTSPWMISPRTGPKVDVSRVIAELTAQDSSWYLNTFKKMAKFGLGLLNSTLRGGLPGALGYLTESVTNTPSMGGARNRNYRSAT